jgi:imidazolonepropionase-like amidohydrolase
VEHTEGIDDDVIRMMVEKKTYCVPTLTIYAMLVEELKKKSDVADFFDEYIEEYRPAEEKEAVFANFDDIFRKMMKAGIRMAVGTDAVFHWATEYPGLYFDEIERFVKNGYTPMEAIVAATKIGAEVCGASKWLGTVERGKVADLLILNGNPLKDITALRDIDVIIQNGKVIER